MIFGVKACFSIVFFVCGMIFGYYVMNAPVTAQMASNAVVLTSFGCFMSLMQSVGVIGKMSFEWSQDLDWLLVLFLHLDFFLLPVNRGSLHHQVSVDHQSLLLPHILF